MSVSVVTGIYGRREVYVSRMRYSPVWAGVETITSPSRTMVGTDSCFVWFRFYFIFDTNNVITVVS